MNEILDAFIKAVDLIITLDPVVIEISKRSIIISIISTLVAGLICIPIGGMIHFHSFKGKKQLIGFIQTLFSLPTVIVGLFVFMMLSKAGPLGMFGLLFTPQGMVIGQVVLIAPIIIGFTISSLNGVSSEIKDTARSLGASYFQTIYTIIKEAKFAIISTVLLGFGRSISEVGIALMIGGNISGFTRVLTTAIALETAKGDFVIAIALGIILMLLSFAINFIINQIQ